VQSWPVQGGPVPRRLLPGPGAELDPADLARLYEHPVPGDGSAWVRANVVATADGAAAGPDGRSRSISSPADRALVVVLRRAAEVVLVGAVTATGEGYRPVRTPIAVASTALDLDLDLPLFTAASTLLLTSEAAPEHRRRAARCEVVVLRGDHVDPVAAVAELAGRGLRRVLCEGGPRLLGSVIVAGALDELCVTVSPLVAGGPAPRVASSAAAAPAAMRLASVLDQDGTLFLRYVLDRPDRVVRD